MNLLPGKVWLTKQGQAQVREPDKWLNDTILDKCHGLDLSKLGLMLEMWRLVPALRWTKEKTRLEFKILSEGNSFGANLLKKLRLNGVILLFFCNPRCSL